MDVHLWAKLDPNGKINSVQSMCSSADEGRSTAIEPYSTASNHGPERFVPYMEKKQLVYTIDAKVDEMSIMIRQLADLTEKQKLQMKLIGEYECKIAAQQKKIQKLEAENLLLKGHVLLSAGKQPHSLSVDRSVTLPKHVCRGEGFGTSTRSLSWPEGINDRTLSSLKYQNTPHSDQSDKHEVTMRDMKFALCGTQVVENDADKASRSQSLSVDWDISGSHQLLNLDVKSHIHLQTKQELAKQGYSCVEKHVEESDSKTDSKPVCELKEAENVKTQRVSSTSLPCDEYGYLDMRRTGNALPVDEILCTSNVADTCSDALVDTFNTDKIHATHHDVTNGYSPKHHGSTNVETESVTKQCSVPDKSRPKACGSPPRYEKIHFLDEHVAPVRPPLPPPRRVSRSKSKISITPSLIDELEQGPSAARTSCTNTHSEDYVEPIPRRKSVPHEPRTRVNDITPTSLPIRIRTTSSSSTESCSPHTPKEFGPSSGNTGEARKDDTCALNRLFKDMRTTREWCKTKKRLMNQSHVHTVDYTEKQLRSVVEDVFKTYSMLKTEHRSRQHTKDKVLEKVKETMEKQRSSTIVSDEFLIKCIDMVIITSPT